MASKFEYGMISKLFTARRSVLDQLKFQEYDTSQYENFSFNEVNMMIENKQQDMLLKHGETGNKAYVCFHTEKAIRPQNVHDMIDDLFHLENILTTNDTLVIIIKDKPNDSLINLLKNLYAANNIFITVLFLAQLQFNILEHSYVPIHKKLSREDALEIRKRYNIKDDSNFPEISRFDPVSLVIGLKPGEICHIIRPSKTSVEDDYYRICVNK
jgi:DNA-directed RNA polymerases I, II, and III subunit RPABC1